MSDTKKSLSVLATLAIAGLFAANAVAGDAETVTEDQAQATATEASEAAEATPELTDEQLQSLRPAAGGAEEAIEAGAEEAAQ